MKSGPKAFAPVRLSAQQRVAAGALLWSLCAGWPAHAALGESASSALDDGRVSRLMHMLRADGGPRVADTTVVTPTGVVVHEYSGLLGVVFAIAWSGDAEPDLGRMFGAYYPVYEAWRRAHPMPELDSAVQMRSRQLVAHVRSRGGGGSGSAYLPTLVPLGVDLAGLGVRP